MQYIRFAKYLTMAEYLGGPGAIPHLLVSDYSVLRTFTCIRIVKVK